MNFGEFHALESLASEPEVPLNVECLAIEAASYRPRSGARLDQGSLKAKRKMVPQAFDDANAPFLRNPIGERREPRT
jgi:hypothetical protein